MEYEKTEEATRREACEKVKQIANAIIRIRKKYFLCFNKISATDQKRYDELRNHMQNIANQNGLEKLSAQLMNDIDTQFGEELPNDTDENGNPSNGAAEDLHQKFVNALAMQAELTILARNVIDTDSKLANAYIKKAIMCQKRAKEYEECLTKIYSKDRLSCDKRTILEDKFGAQIKSDILNLSESVYNEITSKDSLMLEDIMNEINKCTKSNEKIESQLEAEIV